MELHVDHSAPYTTTALLTHIVLDLWDAKAMQLNSH